MCGDLSSIIAQDLRKRKRKSKNAGLKEGIADGIGGMHSTDPADIQTAIPDTNLFFGYQRIDMLPAHFTRICAKCPQLLEHYI
jgi:hypothetical protein